MLADSKPCLWLLPRLWFPHNNVRLVVRQLTYNRSFSPRDFSGIEAFYILWVDTVQIKDETYRTQLSPRNARRTHRLSLKLQAPVPRIPDDTLDKRSHFSK